MHLIAAWGDRSCSLLTAPPLANRWGFHKQPAMLSSSLRRESSVCDRSGLSLPAAIHTKDIDSRALHELLVSFRTSPEFQMQWLAAHIKEAEDLLHKPLLLEEFGKKLDKNVGKEQFLADIKEKRDPIFRTLLAIVKASVKT